ncbi:MULTISPECIES: Type 1 glutamine amidotransferase-like domain-containing protein [Rossellomorea]|uniref:Type 1 glutamine amidotransferase-like domain-containing protein n=1 Tax=Rossellomorea TaxID=2837508 RepID=UPI001CCE58C1|nr:MULTISPECIES: Type 1 glutamine amidotransferase-like domain-containing protein [Rossellomorea]MCA0148425.1 Type 1 glutamine amidotransferase-like domain-containing protein [Rossellomorea vietnamensis]UTE75586.1 Type 1 glutamine amidotransferase-like domain-containing protein [Rossellomorea sp. KS-H15a]WGG47764.1 Type 1 glutamine amidotransferase-like domain-containing protein [Rossellomorea sp. DA94]
MGALYLSGGGDRDQTLLIDREFAGELTGGKSLLYLPMAMDPDDISYEACYEWIKSVFAPLGFQDITMWVDFKGKTMADLKRYSAVYIGGGNTFSLMHHILQSDFHVHLSAFKEEGGMIYGGSAGAIVMGSHIATCIHMDDNDVQLKTRGGLSFLNDFSIWCHYEEENDPLIHQFIQAYRKPVIALSEETGLKIKSGKMEVLGTKPVHIFDRNLMKRVFEPGRPI